MANSKNIQLGLKLIKLSPFTSTIKFKNIYCARICSFVLYFPVALNGIKMPNHEVYYTPPKIVPLPEDYGLFYNSLSDNEKELIELAQDKLGSSFIIRWTHMYKKWKSNNKST